MRKESGWAWKSRREKSLHNTDQQSTRSPPALLGAAVSAARLVNRPEGEWESAGEWGRRGWRLLAGGNEFSPPPAVCLRGRERYRRKEKKSSLNQYQVTSLSASAKKPSSDHSNHRPNRCRARCGLFGASCLHFCFAFAHSFPSSLLSPLSFPPSLSLSLSIPSFSLSSLSASVLLYPTSSIPDFLSPTLSVSSSYLSLCPPFLCLCSSASPFLFLSLVHSLCPPSLSPSLTVSSSCIYLPIPSLSLPFLFAFITLYPYIPSLYSCIPLVLFTPPTSLQLSFPLSLALLQLSVSIPSISLSSLSASVPLYPYRHYLSILRQFFVSS